MPKHGNRSAYDWIELRTQWYLSKTVTLEAFFAERAVPTDTWKKHTKGWHEERTAYRQKIADDALEKHASLIAKTVARHSQYGAAGFAAAFQRLFVQSVDKESGKKVLIVKPGVDDRAVVRLLDVAAKLEREAVKMSTPGATGGQGGDRNAKDVTERELLDRISADPKAMKAAEALYKALPKE